MIESLGKGPLLGELPGTKTEMDNVGEDRETFDDFLKDKISEYDQYSESKNGLQGIKFQKENSDEQKLISSADEKEEPELESNDILNDVINQSKFQGIKGKMKPPANEKEKVIRKFMDSFESELSIPPTRIVEAMAKLNEKDLQAPASETVEKVILHLNLNDQDRHVANKIYSELVHEFNEIDSQITNGKTSQNRAGSDVKLETRINLEPQFKFRVDKNNLLKKNDSLQSLNNEIESFHGTEDYQPNSIFKNNFEESANFNVSSKNNSLIHKVDSSLNMNHAHNNRTNEPILSIQNPNESIDSKLERMIGERSDADLGKNSFSNPKDSKIESAQRKLIEKDEKSFKENFLNEINSVSKNGHRINNESILSTSALAPNLLPNHELDRYDELNIQQIIKQADYLIKNGGGEMKVQLHPEGLGELQIKVSLNDGKLSLSMKADNDKVKKMIEENIVDLKSSLSTHQVALESFDVGTAGDFGFSNENSSGFGQTSQEQNSNPNGRGHSQAQDYWTQFDQNSGSSRQHRNFSFDGPQLRGYVQNESLKLEPVSSSEGVSKLRQRNGIKGLDLVV